MKKFALLGLGAAALVFTFSGAAHAELTKELCVSKAGGNDKAEAFCSCLMKTVAENPGMDAEVLAVLDEPTHEARMSKLPDGTREKVAACE